MLNAHSINVDIQAVQKHEELAHQESAIVHRMHISTGSRKQEPMSFLERLEKSKRQLKDLENWIKAEKNPPLEAENAYAMLYAEVMRMELLRKS
jgi:hypothetical protein